MLLGRVSTCLLLIIAGVCLARDAQIVNRWAQSLGSELWELALGVAKPEELKAKYRELNARVEEKSGEELIEIISESVGRMLRRKMDAVRCILIRAEEEALNHDDSERNVDVIKSSLTYISGKYSWVIDGDNDTQPEIPENMRNDSHIYRAMALNPDSHFYNIPVNTSYSAVHIPTNVYDLSPIVAHAINWSEKLDEVFTQNYRSDPALYWQYFGSMTGMLRAYPAMQWRTELAADGEKSADLYDCRIRSWFIEAATCSKDMVILVDVSGSMEGMGYTIAKAVVASILDTLSNNDFVTILEYTNVTEDLVPCFKDKLIQATPENIETFKSASGTLDPLEVANLTDAFTRAFTLLKTYRETRGCGPDTPCNQLIMLVTDGVASNISEVFDAWNRQENGTRIPVRVFTYLLGREVTMVREIQLMACKNRGYYTHVHTQEEAQEQVLKYIPVVARPLVLQGKEHPIIWTHAYADVSNPALATWLWLVMEHPEQKARLEKHLEAMQQGISINDDSIYIKKMKRGEDVRRAAADVESTARQEYRLLTSVSIPAFDRKGNANNETRRANLLGVAGTDVPINDISKLTLPYKLGVNGYAFIVSNNGYVILHPDLRPVSGEVLKTNYNSVDLTEVEILNDGRKPRDPGAKILELRAALVNHTWGNMKNIPVKFHYDNNRRVTLEHRDYYFAPLPGTPFGIAVAIPNYGKTWIKVGNEIEKNRQAGIEISDFFIGDQWRVHPGWVYCRFHYLEGHEFNNSVDEVRFFLHKLSEPGWEWADQYEAYDISFEDEETPDCTKKVLEDDDYYCNEELMQLLVFDAKATNQSFNEEFKHKNIENWELANSYGVFLRFVATQSGLTRWQYLDERFKPPDLNRKFGDLHRRAVNEPWYKGAIFQHQIDPESISLSVPGKGGEDAVVTVSMAVFPRDGGRTAAAAVIGFQMPMTYFFQRFLDITSETPNPDFNCEQEGLDCYLVDQNGYVVISEAHNDTGQFFGVIEGPVLQSMVNQSYFETVEIYDYQAVCYHIGLQGAGTTLLTPFRHIWNLLLWAFARTVWMVSQFVHVPQVHSRVHSDDDLPEKPPPPEEVKQYHKCDQKRILYMMNQTRADTPIRNIDSVCSRPFYAQRVPQTNLLLVVVNSLYPSCWARLETEPIEINPAEYMEDSDDAACYKKKLNDLPRRPLEGCFTEHPLEDEIDACGRGTRLQLTQILLIIYLIIVKVLL
ncbi:voltage-dependent calcium channel subunit alpha-2/delta-3 isoform X1 [Diachasma alloeum]|uniref:voltage-dependent calcium channel subunit alpha-2/delta-3 isoform X1 n=1 Tax=Diachasma alloeum TaxID=454923 RepID=UPI00073840B1|nr:voltage-dependent calcium channel subunit alpha-2/delta-3 isoform X1 [Diachasma alloeum]